VSSQNFTPWEDRCVRLLVKDWARGMLRASSGRARVQGHLYPGCRAVAFQPSRSGPRQGQPSQPHFNVSVARWLEVPSVDQSANSAAYECRWSRTWSPKAHSNTSAASTSDTRSETADTRPGASRVGAPTSPVGSLHRGNSLCCGCGGNHAANYRDCIKWIDAKAAPAKQAPEHA